MIGDSSHQFGTIAALLHTRSRNRGPRASLDHLGDRTTRLHRGGAQPHHAGSVRAGGRRPLPRGPQRAVDVRGAADHRLRGRPGACRRVARPLRLQAPHHLRRRTDGDRPARDRAHRFTAAGDGRARRRRARGRGHLHLRPAAGAALVPRQAGAAADTAHRDQRPTRSGAVGGAVPDVAGCQRLDLGLPHRDRIRRAHHGAGGRSAAEHPEPAGWWRPRP